MRSDYDSWDECRKDLNDKAGLLLDGIADIIWQRHADKSVANQISKDFPKDKILKWIESEVDKYGV